MDFKELKTKTGGELRDLSGKKREEIRQIRFKVRHGEEKQVRKVRLLRKELARILTLLAKKQ